MIVGKRDRLGSALYREVGRALQKKKIQFQEMVINWKGNQVNLFQSFLWQVTKLRKGNSEDSILDSVAGILPVYKTIGVGNYNL